MVQKNLFFFLVSVISIPLLSQNLDTLETNDSIWRDYHKKGFVTNPIHLKIQKILCSRLDGKPYTGVFKDHRGLYNYKEGVLDGLTLRFRKGKLHEKSYYKDNILNGQRILYKKNGNFLSQYTYIDGKKCGEYSIDDYGHMIKGYICDDKYYGEYLGYYSNGTPEVKGTFENNNRVGVWEWYYPTGNIESTVEYPLNQHDERPWVKKTNYSKEGKLSYEKENDLNFYLYMTTHYDSTGKMSKSGNINYHENKTGPWKYYYSNGQLRMIGEYERGEKVGKWIEYDENGIETEKDYGW
jgi:uncharacterized protein